MSAPPEDPGAPSWSFWIDRGGTFTDVVGFDRRRGRLAAVKVLSSDDAPVEGIRRLLGRRDGAPGTAAQVRLGTTVATNALLEGRFVDAALVVTRGFRDILRIGDQRRPDLFDLDVERPPVVVRRILEVAHRADARGRVLARTADDELLARLCAVRAAGIDSLAICLVFGTKAPALERSIAALARRAGFRHVACSHAVAGATGLTRRAATTALDAVLTPLLRGYLDRLARRLGGAPLLVMQSSGGLAEARRVRAVDTVLSGPAGGVVAAAHVAGTAGFSQAVSLDIGGTSTDVARVLPEPALRDEVEVGGHRVLAPAVDVHTVAAGGGSVCRFEHGRFRVGPESAGADPGPLCYGDPAAQHPTLADACLVLGRLAPDRFPFPLDHERPRTAFAAIARAAGLPSPEAAAEGFFEVAVAQVADAIRTVTAERGFDPRGHALVAFGGAGGQLAGPVAAALGIRTALLDPLAGVLSALGIGLARRVHHARAELDPAPLSRATCTRAAKVLTDLERAARAAVPAADDGAVRRLAVLRYEGTETEIDVPFEPPAAPTDLRARFERAHATAYGYVHARRAILWSAVRLEVRYGEPPPPRPELPPAGGPCPVRRRGRAFTGGAFVEVPVHAREDLRAGHRLRGPCLVVEPTGTIFVDPGFELAIDRHGVGHLRPAAHRRPPPGGRRRDPALRTIVLGRMTAIAEQMGRILAHTAVSTNIRERHDFSCAVFDAEGRLVVNAPHIPVHLGAMGETVRAVARAAPDARDGEAFATNAPALGGTHLPDVTVVRPVFVDGARRFYVAARGHHADIGGRTPGSMPPQATTLHEEGVVLPLLRVAARGVLDEGAVRRALSQGPYPARDPDTNLADLAAQLAACHAGATALAALCRELGTDTVAAQAAAVQAEARRVVEDAVARWPRPAARFEDVLDDGTPIAVAITRTGRGLRVDFAGTGPAHPSNLNAPRAVTTAALLYVLRVFAGRPMPLCAGTLDPVELRIPADSILDPPPDRAVAAGNVETAQRVVDVLLGALGVCAASQGTMNNVTFGDDRHGHYETIGGGAGATARRRGASGVHTHMTNTKITDPEILERDHAVRLAAFAIRDEPGGRGRHVGGRGLVRVYEFLRPLHLAVVSQRRTRPPYGLAGGEPGPTGENRLDGRRMPASFSTQVAAGTRLAIRTPGGGGYGPPRG